MMRGHLLYLLVFSAAFLSCTKQNRFDCFKSNGPETTQLRTPGVFDMINVADKFEVEIFKGPEHKVEITAGRNVIGNILASVSGRTLNITNENKCNFVRGYKRTIKVKVTLPHLQYLENNGVGVVKINPSFEQDSIHARVASSGDMHVEGTFKYIKTSSSGNGDMYVSGSTNTFYVYTNGINFVKAQGLTVSDYMFIHSVTIGDCYVNATGTKVFEYNIQKEGNIYYSGTPGKLTNFSSETASGQLIQQ